MKEHDCLRRFLFEDIGVRGNWVCLNESWRQAIQFQQANSFITEHLGQALAAVTMLSATIKFKGSMILQAQGDGAIRTLIAQATDDRKIRGLVRCNHAIEQGSLEELFGNGHIVLTIDREQGSPYQGVVPMIGSNFGEALQSYFQQSEQLNTRVWLAADAHRAVGLLLQELPASNQSKEDWERIEMLTSTVTQQELLTLDSESLLYRLFHQEKVRLFDPEPVAFACTCSLGKIEGTLQAVGRDELDAVLSEHGYVEVNCEFCGRHYRFDRIAIERLFSTAPSSLDDAQTRH
ncbi:MAG: Hsp33 family molecular chaperone HslO [Methylomicrobium sp.]